MAKILAFRYLLKKKEGVPFFLLVFLNPIHTIHPQYISNFYQVVQVVPMTQSYLYYKKREISNHVLKSSHGEHATYEFVA